MDVSLVRETVESLLPQTQEFLCRLIGFPSTPGQEHDAMCWLDEQFEGLSDCTVKRVPMSDALTSDPDYSDPVPGISYDGRFNLRVSKDGAGNGRTVLFNAHTDVVPPSEGQDEPFTARVEGGTIHGRGACDDKGPVATVHLVLHALQKLGISLAGDVVAHLVCEEENGGNGSLAMARQGEKADACVVLEPSTNKVFTSIRGAVWFRITFNGKAGHSGQAGKTRSALLMARDAMAMLEKYHDDLLDASRGLPLFDPYPNPMPITFGRLQAGNWPASAPSRATLEGVLGLLPNKTKEEVCAEMRAVLLADGVFAPEDFELVFMYRHDSSVVEPGHELPRTLLAAGAEAGLSLEIDAMTASCDAWLYNNQLGIPTVVYGPGTLGVAHSKDERIAMSDIAECAVALIQFLTKYCGVVQ